MMIFTIKLRYKYKIKRKKQLFNLKGIVKIIFKVKIKKLIKTGFRS